MSESKAGPGVKRKVIFAACVLAGMGLAVWLAGGFNREPLYQGKPIRWWVDQACSQANSFDEQRAVEEIGPEAIPCLIAKLRIGNTFLWKAWIGIHPNLPGPLRQRFPLPPLEAAHLSAAECLTHFGPAAKPAVPDLIRLLNGKDDLEVDRAATALAAVGPEAKAALPALREALTTHSSITKVDIAGALWAVGRDTNLVLSFCRRAIAQSLDEGEAGNAALLVEAMGPAAAPLMPILLDALKNPKRQPIGNFARALGALGKTNEAVVRALEEKMKSEQPVFRVNSAMALWRLDPHQASLCAPTVVEWIIDRNKRNPKSRQSLAQCAKEYHLHLAAARAKLVELSQSGSPEVRAIAAEALQSIDAESAIPQRDK
ncbi:MAG: HEAT repeat domain-containing protein [Limisphaerales bacterium]